MKHDPCQLQRLPEAGEELTLAEKLERFLVQKRRGLARRLHVFVDEAIGAPAPPTSETIGVAPAPPKSEGQFEVVPGPIRAGDLVRVKSLDAIQATLDADGKCRGLVFMAPMAAHCGRVYRVRKPVERMFDERAWKMLKLKDVITLEAAICNGIGMHDQETCDRGCFFFFKTQWVDKVVSRASAIDSTAQRQA